MASDDPITLIQSCLRRTVRSQRTSYSSTLITPPSSTMPKASSTVAPSRTPLPPDYRGHLVPYLSPEISRSRHISPLPYGGLQTSNFLDGKLLDAVSRTYTSGTDCPRQASSHLSTRYSDVRIIDPASSKTHDEASSNRPAATAFWIPNLSR